MGNLTLHTGSVSQLRRAATGSPQTAFHLDSHRVVFRGSPSLGDGDLAIVAGVETRHAFRALALRNDSTGVVYGGPAVLLLGLGVLLGAMGLGLLSSGAGWLMLPFAAWCVVAGLRYREARRLVHHAPVSPGAAAARR